MLRAQYAKFANPEKLATLRFSMFCQPGRFAGLRGHAMETHHVLLALPGLLAELHDGSDYHEIRLRACTTLVKLHSIFADADIFLTDAQAKRALYLADMFHLHNNYLLTSVLERNQLLYNFVTKTPLRVTSG